MTSSQTTDLQFTPDFYQSREILIAELMTPDSSNAVFARRRGQEWVFETRFDDLAWKEGEIGSSPTPVSMGELIAMLDDTKLVEWVHENTDAFFVWESDIYPGLSAYYERQNAALEAALPASILERLRREGTIVYRHETDEGRPGGAWADYVYELDGEYWTYLSGDEELDGPFGDLDDALSASFDISSVSVSHDSTESTAAEMASQMSLDFASEGDTVRLNGEEWRVVREEVPSPVSRQEVLRMLRTVAVRAGSSDAGGAAAAPAQHRAEVASHHDPAADAAAAAVEALRTALESGEEIDLPGRLQAYPDEDPEIVELLEAIRVRGYEAEPAAKPTSVLRLVRVS
jgi:hypothetical protein